MISELTIKRLELLNTRCLRWRDNPVDIPMQERLELSIMFSTTFENFLEFAELGMQFLGFPITPIQLDIAKYMQECSDKSMVQAQRGQAKSTLAALYAVWTLIRNNSARILVVSAGARQASDVARMIVRLIQQWNLLCWLRADPNAGDRFSTESYDVHYSLRGVDKSASVTCMGVTANLQGARADLLIPDDVETQKNSMTQVQREQLALLTKEFSAICSHGKILYLGTPQTKDSVYKQLRSRGFQIRIWTSRYPNSEEIQRYRRDELAPIILDALEADPSLGTGGGISGQRGKPVDPQLFSEETLQAKELDYGAEGYALQYMLDTMLSDLLRQRINVTDMPVVHTGVDYAPDVVHWSSDPRLAVKHSNSACLNELFVQAVQTSTNFVPFTNASMFIDPAGSGGDEVAFCIGAEAAGYLHLFTTGGFAGGFTEENCHKLIKLAQDYRVRVMYLERNMGHGTATALMQNCIRTAKADIGVQDYYVTGQKERRIIDTIAPVVRRHRLVVHKQAIDDDWLYCLAQPESKRQQFSLFRQLTDITYDRNSLAHDDRADCLQAFVAHFGKLLGIDENKVAERRAAEAAAEFLRFPLGRGSGCPDLGAVNLHRRWGGRRI